MLDFAFQQVNVSSLHRVAQGESSSPAVFPTASPNARVVADLQVGQLLRFVSELVFALGRRLDVQHHAADALEAILRLAEKRRVHPIGLLPERIDFCTGYSARMQRKRKTCASDTAVRKSLGCVSVAFP